MHEIEILHRWGETAVVRRNRGSSTTTKKCRDCRVETSTLHLTVVPGSRRRDSTATDDLIQKIRRNGETLEKVVAKSAEADQELLACTEFDSIMDLLRGMEQRYENLFSAGSVPFKYVRVWAYQSQRDFKRKALLAIKQGLVCNRCDSIKYSFDDLTVDHIVPIDQGGQTKLPNLQLLCAACNSRKSNGEPTELDKAPFLFDGEPCIHQITCVEVAQLRGLSSAT